VFGSASQLERQNLRKLKDFLMFPLARIQFLKFAAVDLEAQGDHPLRAIRSIVNEALALLEGELAALYARIGRPSIAPEKLLWSIHQLRGKPA
jgi:transposase